MCTWWIEYQLWKSNACKHVIFFSTSKRLKISFVNGRKITLIHLLGYCGFNVTELGHVVDWLDDLVYVQSSTIFFNAEIIQIK